MKAVNAMKEAELNVLKDSSSPPFDNELSDFESHEAQESASAE